MEKINLEPFVVIGITTRTTNENQQAMKDIPVLWEQFLRGQVLANIPNKIDDSIYCIYTEYESDYTRPYTTLLGCRVQHALDVPEGMRSLQIEGGRYVPLLAKGDLSQNIVGAKWGEIWQMDLKRRYTADFEVYGPETADMSHVEVDIYIAVE